MERQPTKTRALLDLWAAHKELSVVEAQEARQTVVAAVAYVAFAAAASLVGWCAANVAIVMTIDSRLNAVCAVAAANFTLAAVAAWKGRSLLRRPLFALTRREVARDSQTLFELVS